MDNATSRESKAMLRRVTTWVAVGEMIALLTGSAVAQGAKKPDGTVKLTEGSAAVGIGWSWGKGVLTYKGKTYPFKIDGLSVGELGVTKAQAASNVFSLKNLEDFSGIYRAARGGRRSRALRTRRSRKAW